jgi:hypothetical protein
MRSRRRRDEKKIYSERPIILQDQILTLNYVSVLKVETEATSHAGSAIPDRASSY